MPSLTRTSDTAPANSPDFGPGHRDCPTAGVVRVVGRVPVAQRSRTDCDQPLRAVCSGCGGTAEWRCDSYGCAPCGETKRRRLMRVIEDGAGQHLENGLHGYFVTLTAPGTGGHKRWYQGARPRRRRDCDCHDHGLTPGQWNRQESACWNRLRTALARDQRVIFAGSVETQKRGLLHRHVVVFSDQPLDPQQVQEFALRAGYGCVFDVEPLQSARKAARYIAKYVTKSTAERSDVPWTKVLLDTETGELTEVPVRATYRLWSSSQRWGVTMKQIREAASAQARARAMYLRELAVLLAADGVELQVSDGGSDPPP